MSNKHIENLTVRLLQALDKNYDVVNMDAVLSVIVALENTKITKEQLETTRLAKYINLFRRRTQSEQLAKRAKSLLKRWREMVGMQQRPLSSCNEFIRNDSATSSNFQENINLLESIPSIQQNTITSCTSTIRNFYGSSLTADKTTDAYKNVGKITAKTVPTSFSNVLAGVTGTPTERGSNPPSSTSLSISNGPSSRRNNSNIKRSADFAVFSDNFSFEQQSSLNSVVNNVPLAGPTKLNISTEPIIIDIEDSNSGSNLMESVSRLCKEDEIAVDTIAEKPNKRRKAKKDKKRARERGLSTPLVVIDAESSLSQQLNLRKSIIPNLTEKDLPFNVDEKSRNDNIMTTNISEILSLSNSSMSSVFPTSSVGATKNIFSQHGNPPLSESDLSFAGKFAHQSGYNVSPVATIGTAISENKSNFLSYNETAESKSTAVVSGTSNTFQHFIGTVCSSNESASNSQHSTFEIIDVGSQGNKPESKRLESDLCTFPMHRPKFATNKDTIIERHEFSLMCGAIQPQANLVNTKSATATPISEQKIPKKRGRKKGSKGIDSLIAKDTSLSSHMLIQSLGSGGKKVKTTKELYAEMQNRKLGVSTPTTPSHWIVSQQQTTFGRRASFCSEPSLHSPRTFDACSTNATLSTIATSSTPEKILHQRHTADIDSGSDSLISGGQTRESVASISSEKVDHITDSNATKFLTEQLKKQRNPNLLTAVENQLRELVEKLPTVPSIETIEIGNAKNTVPCTCKILEILPKQMEEQSKITAVGNLLSLDALKASNENALKVDGEEHVITISVGSVDNSNEQQNSVTAGAKEPSIKSVPEKPKRSIFDSDFEDDEDPLHTLIAEVNAASRGTKVEEEISSNKTAATTIEQDKTSKTQETLKEPQNVIVEQQLTPHEEPQLALPAFPTYKVEEDKACLAKERFELQTQKITNFHIRALHNCYIPNVNGNWDDALVHKNDVKVEAKLLEDGSNVVPKYCLFGSDEYIKKDLRMIDFERNFEPKSQPKSVEQLFYETPFLGISRCLKSLHSSHRKTRKHRQTLAPKSINDIILSATQKELPDETHNAIEPDAMFSNRSDNNIAGVNDESYNRFSKMSSSPQLKLVFDDISINVDETNIPITKGDATAETQTLLTIASNVNFNNNQIENNLVEVVQSTVSKNCVKFEEETAILGLDNASHERIVLNSDNGDLKNNNNNCNEKLDDSSCESHSSLKQTQKSINIKLRRQRRQKTAEQQIPAMSFCKRKRRRKKSLNRGKRQKIKFIKIAINGGITTQRHITMGNSSDEDDGDEEYGGDNSYGSDSDEHDGVHTVQSSDTNSEQEVSETSEPEQQDRENAFKSGESDWEQFRDANVSEYECVEDGNDYEYDVDDDDEELEEEDEFSGEFHEVVTRDISPSTESGNNHIVLTIKKTPSKLNSPGGSLPPVSPVVSGSKILLSQPIYMVKNEFKTEEISKNNDLSNNISKSRDEISGSDSRIIADATASNRIIGTMAFASLLQKYKVKNPFFKPKRRILRRKAQVYKPFRFPDELSSKPIGIDNNRIFKKLHQQLFFPHELFVISAGGKKERLFDISSCSSSCAELSDYEYESLSDKDAKGDTVEKMVVENLPNESTLLACDSVDDNIFEESTTDNEIDEETIDKKVVCEDEVHIDVAEKIPTAELPDDNNGLLVSFNNICTIAAASTDSVTKQIKCDELCSKEINNIKFSGDDINSFPTAIANNVHKSEFMPLLEYTTGLRAVDEDVHYEVGNNCDRLQQFKEWHQLLQLRSYNDELLTVLPYVVLD